MKTSSSSIPSVSTWRVPEPDQSVISFHRFHLSLTPSLCLSVSRLYPYFSVPSGTLNMHSARLHTVCDLTPLTPKLQGLTEINIAICCRMQFRTILDLNRVNSLWNVNDFWKCCYTSYITKFGEVLSYMKCVNVFQPVTVKGRNLLPQREVRQIPGTVR